MYILRSLESDQTTTTAMSANGQQRVKTRQVFILCLGLFQFIHKTLSNADVYFRSSNNVTPNLPMIQLQLEKPVGFANCCENDKDYMRDQCSDDSNVLFCAFKGCMYKFSNRGCAADLMRYKATKGKIKKDKYCRFSCTVQPCWILRLRFERNLLLSNPHFRFEVEKYNLS